MPEPLFTKIVSGWASSKKWPYANLARSKRDSKLFAISHGIPAPQVYWIGRSSGLPSWRPAQYVIKPNDGHSSRDVYIVRDGRPINYPRDEVVLLEEYIPTEGLTYSFWMVQDELATIQVRWRPEDNLTREVRMRFYARDWSDGLVTRVGHVEDIRRPKPDCLEEMIAMAQTLGKAAALFLRVDFFVAPKRGPLFNEVTHNPNGLKQIHPHADRVIGEMLAKRGLLSP